MQKRLIVLMLCVVIVSAATLTSVVAAKQAPTTVAPQARSLGDHIANFLRISNYYILKILNMVLRSLGIQLPPGATIYPGTLQRINSDDRDYDLVYTDASGQKVTIYLDPSSISPNTLPSVIPTPVALDYVYNIDGYHYTVSFVYQGVTYSAHWTPATLNPYLTYEAHYKGDFFTDFIFGTVWLNTWDEAQHKTVQTGAEGVSAQVWWQDPPTQRWELFDTGSTNSQGHFCAKVTGMTTKDYKVDFSLGDWGASTGTLSSTDRPSYC